MRQIDPGKADRIQTSLKVSKLLMEKVKDKQMNLSDFVNTKLTEHFAVEEGKELEVIAQEKEILITKKLITNAELLVKQQELQEAEQKEIVLLKRESSILDTKINVLKAKEKTDAEEQFKQERRAQLSQPVQEGKVMNPAWVEAQVHKAWLEYKRREADNAKMYG